MSDLKILAEYRILNTISQSPRQILHQFLDLTEYENIPLTDSCLCQRFAWKDVPLSKSDALIDVRRMYQNPGMVWFCQLVQRQFKDRYAERFTFRLRSEGYQAPTAAMKINFTPSNSIKLEIGSILREFQRDLTTPEQMTSGHDFFRSISDRYFSHLSEDQISEAEIDWVHKYWSRYKAVTTIHGTRSITRHLSDYSNQKGWVKVYSKNSTSRDVWIKK